MNKRIENQILKGRDWKLEVTVRSIRKLREDSTWGHLTPEQIELLEEWLFEENLGYAKIVERVKQEFGIETTIPSVARYYRRRAPERQAHELLEAQADANALNGLGVDANSLRTATLNLVAKAALKVASEKPQETEKLTSMAELLLEAEQNDLRRGRLKLAEQYFHYEATAASIEDLPRLRAYLQAIGNDTSLSKEERIKCVQDIFFHWDKATKKRNKSHPK